MNYGEYLRSPQWAATRQEALRRAGHHCQLCAETQRLEVHHNNYERLGRELPADLIVLCERCHVVFHTKRDRRTRKKLMQQRETNPRIARALAGSEKVRSLPGSALLPHICEPQRPPAGENAEPVLITAELLARLMSSGYGIRDSTLQMLGERLPIQHGWKRRIIGRTFLINPARLQYELAASDAVKAGAVSLNALRKGGALALEGSNCS